MANNAINSGVPKLKGSEDYATWKFSMQAFLEVDGLYDVVIGEEAETDPTKVAVLNRKAKARIIMSVDPINFAHIQSETTAKGVWDKLQKTFDDSGLCRRVGLLRTLVTTRLEQCEQHHITENTARHPATRTLKIILNVLDAAAKGIFRVIAHGQETGRAAVEAVVVRQVDGRKVVALNRTGRQ